MKDMEETVQGLEAWATAHFPADWNDCTEAQALEYDLRARIVMQATLIRSLYQRNADLKRRVFALVKELRAAQVEEYGDG